MNGVGVVEKKRKFLLRMGFDKSHGGVVVVGTDVDHGMFLPTVGEKGVIGMSVGGKEQNFHPRIPVGIQKCRHIRARFPQIFRDDGGLTPRGFNGIEERFAGTGFSYAELRGG